MWEWDFVEDLSWIWLWSGFFAFLATALSLWSVYKHLLNYTKPHLQRYIVRIILMVPIYAIDSWISLRWIGLSVYLDVVRDTYEAYVVYTFFSLLISYINTNDAYVSPADIDINDEHNEMEIELDEIRVEMPVDTNTEELDISPKPVDTEDISVLIEILNSKPPLDHPWPFYYCVPKFQPSKKFLVLCQRLIYQFVVIKPLIAILTIYLQYKGWFQDGNLSPNSAYLYLIIVDNISVSAAMYMLVLFYTATKEELKPFDPIPKFLCIKAVILFAFWQGIVIAVLVWFGIIHGNEELGWSDRDVSIGLQDFLICIEMFIISIAHRFTFHHKPFRSGEPSCEDVPCYTIFCCCCCCFTVTKNLSHVVSQRDMLEDGVEIFSIAKVPQKISKMGKEARNTVKSIWDKPDDREVTEDEGDVVIRVSEEEMEENFEM